MNRVSECGVGAEGVTDSFERCDRFARLLEAQVIFNVDMEICSQGFAALVDRRGHILSRFQACETRNEKMQPD